MSIYVTKVPLGCHWDPLHSAGVRKGHPRRNCTDFFAVVRNANNTYDNAVYAALPTSANAVTTNHLDALRGFAASVQMAPLSAAATTLYNGGAALAAPAQNAGQAWFFNVDGANLGELFHLVEIYKHHPRKKP